MPRRSPLIPCAEATLKSLYEVNNDPFAQGTPVTPPKTSEDTERSESLTQHPAVDPPRKASQDGYKLQPIAYSPNPQKDEDFGEGSPDSDRDSEGEEAEEEGNQSWDEGDEEPPQSPEPQEPKSLTPQVAPRLPMLYFEQDSIGQIDFAYRNRSRSASRSTTRSKRKHDQRNGQPQEDIPPPPQLPKIDVDANRRREEEEEQEEPRHRGETVRSPASQDAERSGRKDDKGASFYWHSPHSSEGGSTSSKRLEGGSDDPKPAGPDAEAGKRPQEPLSLKNTTKTVPENSLTSATALEFGGPSDWEHFGDYDAEEVDDIALYTSNKPKTAELPGNASGSDAPDKEEAAHRPGGPENGEAMEREVLPTIQERKSELLEDDPVKPDGSRDAPDQRGPAKPSSRENLSSSAQAPSQSTGSALPAGVKVEQESESRSDANHDIIISNDGGNLRKLSPPPMHDKSRSGSLEDSQRNGSSESVGSRKDASPSKEDERTDSAQSGDKKRMHSQDRAPGRADTKHPNRTPSEGSGFRGLSRASGVTSILSSPIDEDDGKENIIISLQVPDSAPPNPNPPPRSPEQRYRENNPIPSPRPPDPKALASPDVPPSARRSVFPNSIEMEDPYAGLDPWAKASLNRYVKMLREEAQAPAEEDKFTIFTNFTHNETRVRVVLYDMDDESDMSDHPNRRPSLKSPGGATGAAGAAGLRPRVSVRSKALPALPPTDDVPPMPTVPPARADTGPLSPDGTTERSHPPVAEKASLTGLRERAGPSPSPRAPGSAEDNFVLVDAPAEDKAGRAKGAKDKGASNGAKGTPTLSSWKRALEIVSARTGSTGAKEAAQAPAAGAGDPAKPDEPTAYGALGAATPPLASTPAAENGEAGEGSEIAFKPSKGSEGRAYEGDKAANRQTIYRPFSTLLRSTSVRHPSGDHANEKSKQQEGKAAHGESPQSAGAAPPLLRRPSNDDPAAAPAPPKPVNYRYTVLEPLLLVIPQERVLQHEPAALARLRAATAAVPDDFAFIHKTVLAWDAEAKRARERHERERSARTGANEARIDALFHDREIGYGDIHELEAEFQRAEAAAKAEEDRDEVATFVASVFDVVWARINYEMDQLTPLYDECTQLVGAASAGRGMFEAGSGGDDEPAQPQPRGVPIAPAMEILLVLYQKLMVRHQKAFEAVLERDRRLKKTEVAPWYALGSIEKVKRIERRFEDAERKAILEFCRQRDERANLLMDVLDQNTLRGVGANQDYMESIMQAVRTIALDMTRGGGSGGAGPDANGGGSPSRNLSGGGGGGGAPAGLRPDDAVSGDEVLKARTVTTALARSSEQIVQTFHVADMLLNAADYEVSVANAKLSGADAAAFRRLRDAKAKEDSKLALDLEHRMGLIRGDTARTQEEIEKLLGSIAAREAERTKTAAAAAAAAGGGAPDGGPQGAGATPAAAADGVEDTIGGEKENQGPRGGAAAPPPSTEEGKTKKKP